MASIRSLVSHSIIRCRTIDCASASSHSGLSSTQNSSSGDSILSSSHTTADKLASKAWQMNSSVTLKVFPSLSTRWRLIQLRRLQSDPGSLIFPQNARRSTHAHSHKKWKSPAKDIYVLPTKQWQCAQLTYVIPLWSQWSSPSIHKSHPKSLFNKLLKYCTLFLSGCYIYWHEFAYGQLCGGKTCHP